MTTTLPILERWLPVPGCETALVSSTGRVYDTVASHYIAPRGEGEDATVTLTDELGRTWQRNLARVVVSVFGHAPRTDDERRDPIFVVPANDTPPTPTDDPDGVVTDIAWRAISLPDVVEGYQVSELGEMLSYTGNILSPSEVGLSGKSPKLLLSLARPADSDYASRAMVRLDDMVALAFLPPRPSDRHFPEHINGDWRDCRAENLRWAKIPRQTHQVASKTTRKDVISKLTKSPDFRPVVTEGVAPGRFWVSRKGEVVGLTGNPLRRHNRNGVQLRTGNGSGNTTRPVSVLVMEAFSSPAPSPRHRVMFHDGDPTNCALDNMFWGVPDQDSSVPSPQDDGVEIITTTVYRYGGIEVTSYPGGRWEHPPMTPTNAAALARIFKEISQRTVGE